MPAIKISRIIEEDMYLWHCPKCHIIYAIYIIGFKSEDNKCHTSSFGGHQIGNDQHNTLCPTCGVKCTQLTEFNPEVNGDE